MARPDLNVELSFFTGSSYGGGSGIGAKRVSGEDFIAGVGTLRERIENTPEALVRKQYLKFLKDVEKAHRSITREIERSSRI